MQITNSRIEEVVFHMPEGYNSIEEWLEKVGRTCYKSEDKITKDSAKKFLKNILNKNHQSIIEHAFVSVKVISDRGISHEQARHRLISMAQESSRYCRYSKSKFGNQITVIYQPEIVRGTEAYAIWENCMNTCEKAYLSLLEQGISIEYARSCLPTGLKTEYYVSANLREWMHMIKVRAPKDAHPLYQDLAKEILRQLYNRIEVLFQPQMDMFFGENI